MNFALITNASIGVKYRHPMPMSSEGTLEKADVMLVSSVVLDASRPSFDSQIEVLLTKLR